MNLKLISIILLIVLGVAVIFATVSSSLSQQNEYLGYLATARHNAEREIPYIAYNNYNKALAINNTDEAVYAEYLAQAKLLGDGYYEPAVKGYVAAFPLSPAAHEALCSYHYENESFRSLFEAANAAREAGIATENVKNMYFDCFYRLKNIEGGLDEAYTHLGGVALIKKGGVYGYINGDGDYVIAPKYENASFAMDNAAAVYEDGEWHMINLTGHIVAKPYKPLESLSYVSGERILAKMNGKYGYITRDMQVPDSFEFDDATNFRNGIAAVKKGDKWALIKSDMTPMTDFVFTDVKTDEYNTCVSNGVIFASSGSGYIMYNTSGQKLSETAFEDAYPFAGAEPAAVKKDGKWGFVKADGSFAIEPQYDGAKSIGCGLAPVMVDGKWGYRNSSGDFVIECQFEDCLPFASNGVAAVKQDGSWGYVKLFGYYYN